MLFSSARKSLASLLLLALVAALHAAVTEAQSPTSTITRSVSPTNTMSASNTKATPSTTVSPSKNAITNCLPGQKLVSGICQSCSVGTYSTSAMATTCANCPAGTSTLYTNGQSSCILCDIGTYRAAGDPGVNCFSCNAGKSSAVGASACSSCAAGTYGTNSNYMSGFRNLCLPCAAGYFQSKIGQIACTACALGYNSAAGSAACVTASSTTVTTVRRALSLQDGFYDANASNATAAMVLGSALRAQLAGILGVSVEYILVSGADTLCSGASANAPPVHDTFGSGDPINSDALFGGAPKSNPADYVYVAPQGPLQIGTCRVIWTVIVQVPRGAAPLTFNASTSAPFNASTLAALATYMNAVPATASGVLAVSTELSLEASAASVSPSAYDAPSAAVDVVTLSGGAIAAIAIGSAIFGALIAAFFLAIISRLAATAANSTLATAASDKKHSFDANEKRTPTGLPSGYGPSPALNDL